MVWKKEILISKQMYRISGPATYISRIFGLLPVTVRIEEHRFYWKWSPFYALYSVLIALLLAILTYRGILEDILCGRKDTVRMKAEVDIYVVFTDLSGIQIIMVVGIFISVFKMSSFFKYVECIGEIDSMMYLHNTKSARNTSLCIMSAVLLTTVSMCTADILMYFKTGTDNIINRVMRRYFTVYLSYCIVVMTQYRFWHSTNSILRRLQQINENLDKLNKTDAGTGLWYDNIITITNLYVKLCKATYFLNQFSGFLNTVTLLDILWHFVEAPYHLLSEISGPRKDVVYISMMVAWVLFHVCRLLILVEPCNSCKLEIRIFFTVLKQNNLQFNAAGLIQIHRSLITGLVGTVTTYLVVLMQVKNKN